MNADESAKGPRLIGGELFLEEVSDLDLSGFHYGYRILWIL